MRRLLNTLFVTREKSQVVKDGECLLVKSGGEVLLRAPISLLGGVVCLGRVFVTPQALAHCAENGVMVSYLTENGRFLARVVGPVSGNVLLRRQQFRAADDLCAAAAIARVVVTAKAANCRTVLRRAARAGAPPAGQTALGEAASSLQPILEALANPCSLDEVRGLEGAAAAAYFGVFDHLITQQKVDFFFRERNRRPPLDRVNAMLSFVYTLLVHDVSAACQAVGLDPQVGFLHRDRPGRPSLALDLMEELRPLVGDRLVLSLINRRQVTAKGFQISGSGAVTMSDDCRRAIIVAYQDRKKEEILHPFLEEKLPMGLLPFVQALLLSRLLRGDLDAYPAYFHRT
ncbi:MAG: type I-C CRISPR-associated endonuclease Cas1c [Deltaproteobacteria bacterium]|nr:type I-C CRISPR-associated endonuclease Cas1c [Deltaproteobacteria bacterium]